MALPRVPRGMPHPPHFAACANCRGRLELARRKARDDTLASAGLARYKVTRPRDREPVTPILAYLIAASCSSSVQPQKSRREGAQPRHRPGHLLPSLARQVVGVFLDAGGQLTVEGPFYDKGDSVLAITGGTGEYAGARGEMGLNDVGGEGKVYNFTYRIK